MQSMAMSQHYPRPSLAVQPERCADPTETSPKISTRESLLLPDRYHHRQNEHVQIIHLSSFFVHPHPLLVSKVCYKIDLSTVCLEMEGGHSSWPLQEIVHLANKSLVHVASSALRA